MSRRITAWLAWSLAGISLAMLLLSRPYSTAVPSPNRYGRRYEERFNTIFAPAPPCVSKRRRCGHHLFEGQLNPRPSPVPTPRYGKVQPHRACGVFDRI
jgi:hypothetical protein